MSNELASATPPVIDEIGQISPAQSPPGRAGRANPVLDPFLGPFQRPQCLVLGCYNGMRRGRRLAQ